MRPPNINFDSTTSLWSREIKLLWKSRTTRENSGIVSARQKERDTDPVALAPKGRSSEQQAGKDIPNLEQGKQIIFFALNNLKENM